jgi:23S rRNA pseudouridine2605 synthase
MALGGESARSEEQAKPSRKPAAAGHMPEFVEGPKPRARAPRKETFGGGELPGRPEGGERTYEKKAWRPAPRGVRQDGRGAGPGQSRSARPSFRSEERPFTSRAPRTGDRFDARKGTGRPERSFGSRPPRTGDSFDASKGPGRSFSSRPASREQGDRPFSSRPPRTGDRFDARKGRPERSFGSRPASREQGDRPFRSAAPRTDARYGQGTKPGRSFGTRPASREQGDRPFRRPDERTGTGTRSGGGRPFPASRTRTQEYGPRSGEPAPRQAGRSEWQRDSRSRGPAPFAGERGPRKSRPAPGAGDRPRSRPGAPARPAGTFPRGPKGPARRRS